MAESPNLSSQSERAERLAERFGMTRADIEHLLTQTHSEYAGGTMPAATPAAMPVNPAEAALPVLPPQRRGPKPLSGGALAAIFAILLIGLAIALSLKEGYFQQRPDRRAREDTRTHTKAADSLRNKQADSSDDQSTPPFQPTTVPPGELPPEAQVGHPHTEHPALEPSHRAVHPEHTAARPLLQTSSNFEAEEKLADLRADGNTKARIKSVRKNGTINYQVIAK